MKAWKKAALAAGAAAGWARWMEARNVRRPRPPLRDAGGDRIRFRSLTLDDGAEVPFVDTGRGPPMVLVPGADGVVETFRYQLPSFAERHRVVCAGLRSEFPGGRSDFDLLTDDLLRLVRARGTGPAVLLGQSLGSAVAIRFAVRYPKLVRALVVSGALARFSYEHVGLNRTGLIPLAQATTRYLPEPAARATAYLWCRAETWMFDDSPGRDKVVDYALRSGPRTVSSAVSSRRVDLFRGTDLRPQLGRVVAPTLVLAGERDAYTPPEWAREIASLLPDARYVEIPRAGHCAHVSTPGLYNAVVLDWTAGVLDREGRDDEDEDQAREAP